jgi:tetratricopeptide (TPR) repeat protein
VFAGGCSLAAAEKVCGSDTVDVLDVVDTVAALVDKSMIVATDEPDGDVRYTLLETIRMYAAERLEALGEQDRASAAHLAWTLELAGDGLPLGVADQLRWLDQLDREHDNLRSALAWAFAHAPVSGAQLAGSLHRFWDIRGHFDEASRWLPAAVRVEGLPLPTRAEVLRGAANLAHSTGQLLDALELNQQSAEVARACDDRTALCAALNNMGLVRVTIGDFDPARALFQEMAEAARGLPNEAEWAASAATVLADAAWQESRFDEAETLLAASRRSGPQGSFYSAFPDYPAALLAARRGDLDAAWTLLSGERDGIQRLGEPLWTVDMLAELAAIATAQSRFDEARELLEEGFALTDGLPLPAPRSSVLHAAAMLERATGGRERAAELASEALEIRRRLGLKVRVAETLELVAGLQLDRGEPSGAAVLFGAAEALRGRLGAPIPSGQRASYQSDIAHTRDELGERFTAAWEEGQHLDIEGAVGLALTGHTS